jgi:DNA-binding transcriptional LysR family regulator
LACHRFDLALRNSALEDSSLKGRRLADDKRVLCASPSYLGTHGVPEHPDDLHTHQLIGFKNSAPKPLIGPDGESGEFNPRRAGSRLVVDDGLSQKVATLAGAGISMNSLWSVHRELAEGSLVRALPSYEVNDQSVLRLVYQKSNVLTAKVRVFIDFLSDKIGKSPIWSEPESSR